MEQHSAPISFIYRPINNIQKEPSHLVHYELSVEFLEGNTSSYALIYMEVPPIPVVNYIYRSRITRTTRRKYYIYEKTARSCDVKLCLPFSNNPDKYRITGEPGTRLVCRVVVDVYVDDMWPTMRERNIKVTSELHKKFIQRYDHLSSDVRWYYLTRRRVGVGLDPSSMLHEVNKIIDLTIPSEEEPSQKKRKLI